MIYGRFGDPVEIVRRAVLADVRELDHRKPDKQDRDALAAGSYVVIRDLDSGALRLYHLAFLRADDGAREITAVIEVLDATPHRCIRCNTDYTAKAPCRCGARASLRDSR